MTVPHHSEPAREAEAETADELCAKLHEIADDGDTSVADGNAICRAAAMIKRLSASPAPAAGGLEAVAIAIAVRDALIRGVYATSSNSGAECDFRGPQDSETGEIPCDLGENCACVQIAEFADRVVKNMRSLDIPKVLALASPAASPVETQGGDGVAVNKAEAILRQVRKFITAEMKHARSIEEGKNSTRDDVDMEHSLLVGFTVQDCDEALRIVKRRAAALAPFTSAATRGEPAALTADDRRLLDKALEASTEHLYGFGKPAPAVESAQDRISVLLDKIEAEARGDLMNAQMNGSFRGESIACGKLGVAARIRASLDLATDAEG